MDLIFTKRAGKYDELSVLRGDMAPETISCPKQGIIPHDMVHYAVESHLVHRGFLTHVAEGGAIGFAVPGDRAGDSEEAIERLVETFQAEMWGGRVPASDLIATYEHACNARGHGAAPVSEQDISAIRERLDELTDRWQAVEVNGSLTLKL